MRVYSEGTFPSMFDSLLVMFHDFKMHNLSWIPRLSRTSFLTTSILFICHWLVPFVGYHRLPLTYDGHHNFLFGHILEVHSLLCLDVHPMFSIEFKNTFQTYLKRIYYHHCWTCIQHSSWMANVFFMYWTLRRCNLHVVKKWWRGDLLTTSYVLARWWVITCRFCY